MNEDNLDEQLDSPLVVHKESDASYQAVVNDDSTQTRSEDELDAPTLERHRFKKEKKPSKVPYVIAILIVVAAAIFAGLYFTGNIEFGSGKGATESPTKKSYTTLPQNDFEDTITVKGTYLFFEGTEMDTIEDLIREIKYLDDGIVLTIQDENADSNYLNNEVLPVLVQYDVDYNVKYIVSSGLVSKYENNEAPSENPSNNEEPPQSENISE